MVINLINITSNGLMAKEGIGTVQMTLGKTNFNSTPIPAGTTIKLDFTPDSTQDYSVAWDNYFTRSLNMPPPVISGLTRTYTLPPVTTLVIKTYEVQIKNI
jgi:hypothetical protein